jgi:hypothetical protein
MAVTDGENKQKYDITVLRAITTAFLHCLKYIPLFFSPELNKWGKGKLTTLTLVFIRTL